MIAFDELIRFRSDDLEHEIKSKIAAKRRGRGKSVSLI